MAFGITNKGRTSPIAIDFGADALKMLQIVPGDTAQLVAAGTAVVPEHARKDFTARLEFLEESIKTLLKNQPFRGRRAICAIPGYQTLIHSFMLGRCDPEDVNALVDLQLRERLGVEPARMVIRNFHAVDHFRGGKPRSDVVTLAAKRDVVMQYLQLAGRCKLEVVGMHPEPLCLLRGYGTLLSPDDNETVCLVDLGSATTKVLIARGEKLLLAKTIHAAGEHWNRRFAAREKLEFDEARQQRVRSINGGDATGGGTAVAEESAAPNAKRCEITETLTDELRLCFRHHQGRHPDQPISRVVFFGGEACRDELCQQVARALGVAGQLGDPFQKLFAAGAEAETAGVDLKSPQPGWAVAVGLCLSEANL